MMIARVVRSPAVHFLCLGAVLFAAAGPARRPAPSGTVLSDDELLYRAAIELGVDRRDRAVRERLARLASFVGEDPASSDDAARRLGLARNDVVLRRHLALVMRLAAGRLLPEDAPTEDDLRAYLATHASELATPARIRFTHVHLGRDRHGDALDGDARALLDRLRRDVVSPEAGPALGDPFVTGGDVGPLAPANVDRRFGPGFAAALADVPTGMWIGPVRSSYGLHLVWVHERLPASTPTLDAVRGRVVHGVLRERAEARTRERLAVLRAREG